MKVPITSIRDAAASQDVKQFKNETRTVYCGIGSTGISCPVGVAKTDA